MNTLRLSIPVTPALWRWRQEDLKFKASQGYVSDRTISFARWKKRMTFLFKTVFMEIHTLGKSSHTFNQFLKRYFGRVPNDPF